MPVSSTLTNSSASSLLQEAPLRELIAAHVVAGVTAKGGKRGFVLEISFGDRRALLASARGNARVFASLATVAVLMQRLGYPRFEVDVTDYAPGRVRAARPSRSASMKLGRLPEAAEPAKSKSSEGVRKGDFK